MPKTTSGKLMRASEIKQLWMLRYGTLETEVATRKPLLSMKAIAKVTGLTVSQVESRLKRNKSDAQVLNPEEEMSDGDAKKALEWAAAPEVLHRQATMSLSERATEISISVKRRVKTVQLKKLYKKKGIFKERLIVCRSWRRLIDWKKTK